VTMLELEYTTDEKGKLEPTGETLNIAADQVFTAIGQTLKADGSLAIEGRKIAVNGVGRTSRDGVWAGGDCASSGNDLTVTAVAEGRDAAMDIHVTFLGGA
jgi:dihydropyrimidine dehydrogenase (NAD+) subunit PreT